MKKTLISILLPTRKPFALSIAMALSIFSCTAWSVTVDFDLTQLGSNGKTIRSLGNGSRISMAEAKSSNLFIKPSSKVGSMRKILNGQSKGVERYAPYAMGGEGSAELALLQSGFTLGNNTLQVQLYSSTNGSGAPLLTKTITLLIGDTNAILNSQFILTKIGSNGANVVQSFGSSASVTITDAIHLNLFLQPPQKVGSVKKYINDQLRGVEKNLPFAFGGEGASELNLLTQGFIQGTNTVKAVFYNSTDGTGSAIGESTATLQIVADSTPPPKPEAAPAPLPTPTPTPTPTEVTPQPAADSTAAPVVATGTSTKVSSLAQLQSTLNSISGGDQIVLANGTYNNFKLNVSKSGISLSRPIILKAETAGGVILTGASQIQLSGNFIFVSGFKFKDLQISTPSMVPLLFTGANNRAHQFTFLNLARSSSAMNNSNIAVVDFLGPNSHNNRLDSSLFEGIRAKGIRVAANAKDKPSRNRIDHNLFKGFWAPSSNSPLLNGWEVIQVGLGQPSRNHNLQTMIDENTFVGGNADPELISLKSSGTTIHNNIFKSMPRNNICARQGKNNILTGNTFSSTNGLEIFGTGHYIANNRFEAGAGIKLMAGDALQAGTYLDKSAAGISENQDTVSESRIFPAASYVDVLNNQFAPGISNSIREGVDMGWNTPGSGTHNGSANRISGNR